jgi:acyl-CoA synthetase (AMP-forming)/AMP-acid ligase II
MIFQTLPQALEARCNSRNTITCIEGEHSERQATFGDIRRRAAGLLHHFQSRGARAGGEMLLLLDRNEQFIDAFWACLLGGMVAVPLAPGANDEQRRKFFRVLRQLDRPGLCTDEATFARLARFAEANALGAEIEKLRAACVFVDQLDDISTPGKLGTVQADDIAFIQYSSGSTSEPKGVVLSHRNLLTNIDAIARGMDLRPDDTALSWMPLTHDMGLIGFHLTWLVMDISHCLMPTALFVRRPALWLSKAHEKGSTLLCSPNFGYKHYLKYHDREQSAQLDLSAVRLIFNGAEPISVALYREFLETLAPSGLKPTAMFPVYGLAEASLAVTFPKPGVACHTITVDRASLNIGGAVKTASSDDPASVTLACVGHPIDHCEVRIAAATGEALPGNTVGRILIRGDNVTRGYHRDPDATRDAISNDRWLDTGDLGFFSEHGLVVTGRLKEIIFVNGQNHYPQDLEAVLDTCAVVELGRAAVSSARPAQADADEVLAFVLHRGGLEAFAPIARAVRKCINEQLGIVIDHVIPVARIPKTTSGKIQRYLLAQEYQAGTYAAALAELHALSSSPSAAVASAEGDIERTLKEICDEHIKDQPLGVNDNIFEAGTSSLTLAQIFQRIDSVYPGQIEVTDFFDYPTIAELAQYLKKRLAAG